MQLICDAARRASGSLRDRRSLLQQRGPATPPPATTVVRHRARAREPYRGAPARSRRRWAARRPPWPRPAARRARTRRPPSAPRGGAHRCTAQAAPAPGAECAPISGTGGRSRSAAGKSARRRLCGRAHAGEGGDDLVQRGLGRPGACPALGGAAGRPSALAERPNSRKSLRPSLRGGSRAPPGAQSGTRAYLRPRRCVKGHVTRFSDSGCTLGTHRRGR